MLSPWRGLALLLLTAGLMVLEPWSAHAEAEVDLALVLAVDVSLSMEPDEQDLQRQGFVEASNVDVSTRISSTWSALGELAMRRPKPLFAAPSIV